MKNQLVIIGAIATISSLGIMSKAQAGEGGIAAAAAFHLDSSGKVTDIAVAAGVGKTSAAAGAELSYTSVLTSTSFNSSGSFENSSNSSYSGNAGGCYYYYYCGSGPSTNSSTYSSTNSSSSTSTYKPVTNVKAFAVGSAGSLSYSTGGGYYYYYGGGPSFFVSGEDPASVGTAQANTFNLNGLASGVGLLP
jgi:hypothetical protein